MRGRWYQFALWFALCSTCRASDIRADTAQLYNHLKRFREYKVYELSAAEYKSIQSEYLAWIEARLKGGTSVAQMNEELRGAKLLSNGPETVDEQFNRTYAGFLGKVEASGVDAPDDLVKITFGIHTGGACNFDETILLYKRGSWRRIAQINAEGSYTHGFLLRELAVGRDDQVRGRLLASAWVASNCQSNWNGNSFRIDVSRGPSIQSLLDWSVSAYGGDPVRIAVAEDTVTFNYTTLSRDVDVLARDAVARWHVEGGRAIRQTPIAKSYGGFVEEWLEMDESEAARWSTPEAGSLHRDLAARLDRESIKWVHAADCPGSPRAREIGVQWRDSQQTTFFLVGGSTAAEMRMLSIVDKPSTSCRELDMRGDLSRILSEPAR
jgi:hypothetical protein